jgi:hypothetical protein
MGKPGTIDALKNINIFRSIGFKVEGDKALVDENIEETKRLMEKMTATQSDATFPEGVLAKDVMPLIEQGKTPQQAGSIMSGQGYEFQKWKNEESAKATGERNRLTNETNQANYENWKARDADAAAKEAESREYWEKVNADKALSEEENRRFWQEYEANKEAYWAEYQRKKKEEAPSKLNFGIL